MGVQVRNTWRWLLVACGFAVGVGAGAAYYLSEAETVAAPSPDPVAPADTPLPAFNAQGWPNLNPVPPAAADVWQCEVVVISGSLGGVAAAAQAMRSGAQTCLIELTPWLGGQISSQAVSAIDESLVMRQRQNFSPDWERFKDVLLAQQVRLPSELGFTEPVSVARVNRCWVGELCFPPEAGAVAAQAWLEAARISAPNSRWLTATAFKGAEFSADGSQVTAIHAVQRQPRDPANYLPLGRLWREIRFWYSWESNDTYLKTPLRLEPVPGHPFYVIDATDTGELVGWANIPHRQGSESQATTGEVNARIDNPECTQAFTYPFILAIANDGGESLAWISQIETGFSKAEHRARFDLEGFPFMLGQSFFNYRRIVSQGEGISPSRTPLYGDMTTVNWNRGNDWDWMNPTLIMSQAEIDSSGQRQNWMGGLNYDALKEGENTALLFSEWLMQNYATSEFPLAHLSGRGAPIPTQSGLSFYPYIREGRRILGRPGHGQADYFMLREQDVRTDMAGRDLAGSAIAIAHYAVDMHGCRYRNWEESGAANSAPINEFFIDPIYIPLEAIIPQRLENVLIGGKGIAVTHIVNAATRVHYGEWMIGSAAGGIAGRLVQDGVQVQNWQQVDVQALRQHLTNQGLRLTW